MKKEIILSQNQKDLMNELIQLRLKEFDLEQRVIKENLGKSFTYTIKKKGDDIVFNNAYYTELLTEEEKKIMIFKNGEIYRAR